jgi:hypothetical protein
MKEMHEYQKVSRLLKRGVQLPNPATVTIGPEVNLDNISKDRVIIHSGCKIFGQKTLILSGTVIGHEGPATIENCQIGPDVHLKSGYFKDAVFLEKASLGSGSHVREGTILEEQASTAHTVGLKHTILLPFVTLGSLINFCDCLMAGGTSRKITVKLEVHIFISTTLPTRIKPRPSLLGNVPEWGHAKSTSHLFRRAGRAGWAVSTGLWHGDLRRHDPPQRCRIKPQRLVFGHSLKGRGDAVCFRSLSQRETNRCS